MNEVTHSLRDQPINRTNQHIMHNDNSSNSHIEQPTRSSRTSRASASLDELTRVKFELLQAEVRLAKARATAAGAEVDIKVLTIRLKALAK